MILNPRAGGRVAAFLAVAIVFVGLPRARAQERPASQASGLAIGPALATTLSKGVPTVAVFTSEGQPGSVRLWNEFNETAWARANRGLVQLVHVSKEHDAGFVRSSGVFQFPWVVVYARGPKGVTVLSSIQDCPDAAALVARMGSLSVGMEPPVATDPSVRSTAYPGDAYPSQQYQQPSPPPPAVSSPPPPTQQPLTLAMPPPVSTSAGLVQVPGQNLMIQQQPTQVFLAPAQQPIVYVPQAGMSLAAAPPPASQPAQNLYLTASAPAPPQNLTVAAPPPSPAPTLALAVASPPPAPTAFALAAGPAPALAAVTNQTLSLPNSRSRTRIRVRGPGPVASSLARLGERMTQLGRARIETTQETDLESPFTQNAGGGLTTISSTSTTPVAQPQTTTLMAAPAPQAAPPPVCPAPNPAPTPQASPQRQHH